MNYMEPQQQGYLTTSAERQMGLFLHLSQLANLLIPIAGIIVPIVIWQTQKDKMPGIDAHGKMVTNWIISSVIYGLISFVLAFVFIGLLGFLALMVLGIVFPIMGAIKANNGEFFEYPLTIKFLK
ncbi:MAG: DUF4870 domain-containing protein [Pyrinomonadaceae bacterium]